MNVLIYVSTVTSQQPEQNEQMREQITQAMRWCKRNGCQIMAIYKEPRKSGSDKRRPVFSRMLKNAKKSEEQIDTILVHDFMNISSYLNILFACYKRAEKQGLKIVSTKKQNLKEEFGEKHWELLELFHNYQREEHGRLISLGKQAAKARRLEESQN